MQLFKSRFLVEKIMYLQNYNNGYVLIFKHCCYSKTSDSNIAGISKSLKYNIIFVNKIPNILRLYLWAWLKHIFDLFGPISE